MNGRTTITQVSDGVANEPQLINRRNVLVAAGVGALVASFIGNEKSDNAPKSIQLLVNERVANLYVLLHTNPVKAKNILPGGALYSVPYQGKLIDVYTLNADPSKGLKPSLVIDFGDKGWCKYQETNGTLRMHGSLTYANLVEYLGVIESILLV